MKIPRGVCVIILALAASAASAFQAGITVPGSTAYPQGGMRRVGKVTLSSTNYSHLYGGLGDGLGYGYFSTAGSINPGWFVKVDLTGDTPVEVGAASANPGEGNLDSGAIDPAAGYAYVIIPSNPSKVLKFALGAGSAPPTYLGSSVLNAGESSLGAVIDLRDPDPANHFIYVATLSSPASIVKVAPGIGNALPARVSAVTLQPGENALRRGAVDGNGYAYFATVAQSGTTLPRVVKIQMTSGNAAPVRIGSALLDNSTYYSIGSAVLDPANGYGYFGTYDNNVPAKVFKVALGSGSNPPTASTSVTLSAGPPAERELSCAVIDTAGGYAFFGTDHTYAAKIFKIKLGAGAVAPTEVGVLQLQSGTQPNPPDGVNVYDNPETAYGEVFLQSAVVDAAHGYASWGTDSVKGQVVKTSLSEKGALKGTKLVLASGGPIQDVAFYSHAAGGNVRLAIYDDASPKNLLWQSGAVGNGGGWIVVPASLTVVPGTYWLAWQTDSTSDVPSYTAGSAGDGFFVEQPFGASPATLASVTSSSERWSMYVDVGVPPAPTSFYTLTPCRVLDTRQSAGPQGGPSLAAGATRTVTVAGTCGVPSGAVAVAANVAVTQSGNPGNLTLFAGGTALPPTSTINFAAGQTRANNAILPLGSLGDLSIFCAIPSGVTDAILDVTGYFQ